METGGSRAPTCQPAVTETFNRYANICSCRETGSGMARAWPDPEAMAGKSGRQHQTGQVVYMVDNWQFVRREFDHASPRLLNTGLAQVRVHFHCSIVDGIDLFPVGGGIEDTGPFEGAYFVHLPAMMTKRTEE